KISGNNSEILNVSIDLKFCYSQGNFILLRNSYNIENRSILHEYAKEMEFFIYYYLSVGLVCDLLFGKYIL
ncbi:MAG: hypothetical protein QOB17_08455, partial [Nitrososphaeraceae archaeon]|nr:hypothetical protein [Nitrososphaeraceae archaeon]